MAISRLAQYFGTCSEQSVTAGDMITFFPAYILANNYNQVNETDPIQIIKAGKYSTNLTLVFVPETDGEVTFSIFRDDTELVSGKSIMTVKAGETYTASTTGFLITNNDVVKLTVKTAGINVQIKSGSLLITGNGA